MIPEIRHKAPFGGGPAWRARRSRRRRGIRSGCGWCGRIGGRSRYRGPALRTESALLGNLLAAVGTEHGRLQSSCCGVRKAVAYIQHYRDWKISLPTPDYGARRPIGRQGGCLYSPAGAESFGCCAWGGVSNGGFSSPAVGSGGASRTPSSSAERETPKPLAIFAMLTRVTLRSPASIEA